MATSIQDAVDEAVASGNGAEWSVCLRDEAGSVIATHNAGSELSIASAGKLLLLIEVARRLDDTGELSPDAMLSRTGAVPVGQAGIWQALLVDTLPLADVAVLVSCLSDNLATNVLIDQVGLESVAALGSALHLSRTRLHDYCRDERGSGDPPHLSTGSSDELSRLMVHVNDGTVVSRAVCERVTGWLAMNADLSMVASSFGLDPLAHTHPDGGVSVHNKTGGDVGVMADVGFLRGPDGFVAYSVIVNWTASSGVRKDRITDGMHRLGRRILDDVVPGHPPPGGG